MCLLLFSFVNVSVYAQRRPKQNGMVKLRDMRGEVYARGRMNDGKKDGTWREYHNWDAGSSGKRRLSGIVNYRMDVREGQAVYFLNNGDTASFGQLHNNVCVGQWKIYAENKNGLSSIHNYDSLGNKTGWQYEYYPSGSVYLASYYYSPDHFQWVKFTEQGRVVFRICYTVVKGNNILDGDAWYYFEYQAGVYTGVKVNNTDTAAYELQQHKNGLRHGVHRLFTSGKVVLEEYYVDGYLHGHQSGRASDANGMLREVDFVNGKMDGQCIMRTPSMKLFSTTNYHIGIKHGYATVRDTVRNVILEELWYRNGEIDSTRMVDSAGRATYERKRLRTGESVFSICEYYSNGKTKVQRYEKNGMGDSIETRYYENGQIQLQGKMRESTWDGEVKVWNENGRMIVRAQVCYGRDTLPEMAWSDAGKRLVAGSAEYKERLKLLPAEMGRYDRDARVVFPKIIVEKDRNSNGSSTKASSDATPHWNLPGNVPSFPGGETARLKYFEKQIRYPAMEFENEIQGTVYVEFIVTAEGSIDSVKVLRDVSGTLGLSKEVVRVVSAMPKWNPEMRNGKPVSRRCVIGVQFALYGEYREVEKRWRDY